MPKTKTKRGPRLPQIVWKETEKSSTGNDQWLSGDGMLRLTLSNQCYGVKMPKRWVLWRFKAGNWSKVIEGRGRDPVEKRAREIAAEYDAADDDE